VFRAALTVLICIAAVARGAAGQDASALVPGDREASAELAKIIEATTMSGLPVDPILAKIRYAVLVAHASAPRIVAAARAIAARLEEARNALAPRADSMDIAAGAEALYCGVSRKALQNVRKASLNRPVAVPLGVLAQLVVSGVPETRASKYVTDLIKHGATTDQLLALGNDVNSDVAMGTRASNALELRMSRLNAVLGIPTAGGTAATSPADITAGSPKKKP
jgi:hypothetical protein